jgi:small-conductance mechanosensitive channel
VGARLADVMLWVLPLALVAGGVLLGIAAERLVLARLARYAVARHWIGEDLFIGSLRGILLVWCVVAGVYAALLGIPLRSVVLAASQRVLQVVVIASITVVAARLAAGSVGLYSRRLYRRSGGAGLPSPSIVTNFTQLLVLLVGILIVLESLGIAITPILTALGVGGLAVALALQETLSNLFSGLYIITSRQIKPGDYIKLNTGEEGYVVDITWRNTKLREAPNNMILVPNAKLAAATVTNYYQPDKEVAVPVQVRVSYDSNLEKVEEVTLDVAREVLREVPGGVADFTPVILYHTFADASVQFTAVLRARDVADQARIKHAFIKRLLERYHEAGIAVSSRSEVILTPPDRVRVAGHASRID